MISAISSELLNLIFKYLDLKSIKCVILVSKRWRQEGLPFLCYAIMTLNPQRWNQQINSEVIRHIGKIRFRGYGHASNEMNRVLELLMQPGNNFRYHSLDIVGQQKIDLRKALIKNTSILNINNAIFLMIS